MVTNSSAAVGWTAQVASHWALVTPIFTAMAAIWMISGESGPTTWQPRILSVCWSTTSFDHDMVASAVFSQPPVGVVGMSEAQARHAFGKVDIYRSVFRPMKYVFYGGEERCLMKLVVDAASQRIVGVHMVGPDAPEIIQMAAIAVKMGITKAQWDATCAVHPTAAEEFVTMREKYVPPELGGMS